MWVFSACDTEWMSWKDQSMNECFSQSYLQILSTHILIRNSAMHFASWSGKCTPSLRHHFLAAADSENFLSHNFKCFNSFFFLSMENYCLQKIFFCHDAICNTFFCLQSIYLILLFSMEIFSENKKWTFKLLR